MAAEVELLLMMMVGWGLEFAVSLFRSTIGTGGASTDELQTCLAGYRPTSCLECPRISCYSWWWPETHSVTGERELPAVLAQNWNARNPIVNSRCPSHGRVHINLHMYVAQTVAQTLEYQPLSELGQRVEIEW
jgi:hypothetical protein